MQSVWIIYQQRKNNNEEIADENRGLVTEPFDFEHLEDCR